MSTAVFFVVIGQIVRWMLGLFVRPNTLFPNKLFFKHLFECRFCLSTWIYFVFFCFSNDAVYSKSLVGFYVPLVSEMIVALVTAFVVSVWVEGFIFRFGRFDDA